MVLNGVCDASVHGCSPPYRVLSIGSSPWDLGIAAVALAAAMVAAAVVYRRVSTGRPPAR
ncbi:MAG TPA: hypothetical protein VMU72_11215 [Gaiellaceae bacterium]|nr:hypothetical protein [Gaiellaceae bacterium]